MSDYRANIPAAVAQIVAAFVETKTTASGADYCNLTEALARAFLMADDVGDQHGHQLLATLNAEAAAAKAAARK